MSTPDSTKKRRVATDNGGGGVDNNGIVDDGTTMSTILAKLNDMQGELDRCIASKDSMQKEMNTMQSRLSHMDELEKKCDTLETKCTNLDTRCEALQRSVQILSKESTWEYSAPRIPLSHWEGFDEEYIKEMTSLISYIKECTCALRSGEADSIDYGLGQQQLVGALLQHDDILLPHWEEFANALQLYQFTDSIPELSIANVQLSSSVIDLLAPALKGKPFTELLLVNNDLQDKGIEFVAGYMQSNLQMKALYLWNNQLGNMKHATTMLEAVIDHPSITKVHLENCLGGENINSYEAICPLFASDKTWDLLGLEKNNIITGGDTTIPDYITSNPPLKYLYLSRNKLNDNDAIFIAQALKYNTNLEELFINDNNFTDIGKESLLKAVYDPTSLNSVFECNHTCRLELDGVDRDLPNWCRNSGSLTSKSRRTMKIHYVLSLRHREWSNIQHLKSEFDIGDEEDDSLKLTPRVLEVVHKYYACTSSDAQYVLVNPLSIMYEVLRGWKMPELYEKRNL